MCSSPVHYWSGRSCGDEAAAIVMHKVQLKSFITCTLLLCMLPRDVVVVVVIVLFVVVVVVVSCSSLEFHGLAPHAKKSFQEEGTTVMGARKKLTAS
jgi:hypothetical protein